MVDSEQVFISQDKCMSITNLNQTVQVQLNVQLRFF